MPKITVTLTHAANPDIMHRGGYWEPPVDNARPQLVEVKTAEEAGDVVCAYIERNGLGAGNWTGGAIHRDGKIIAHVSYNGRVWPGARWFDGINSLPMDTVLADLEG